MKKINLKIPKYKDLILVNTIESGEKMVNISKALKDCICTYKQQDMFPYVGKDLWVRETVARKLQLASNILQEVYPTHRLKIVYGFCHPEIQTIYFKKRKEYLRLKNKNMNEENLNELAHTMTAYPETAWHPTGGAVDLTISTENGDLDMGTGISDFSDQEKIKL